MSLVSIILLVLACVGIWWAYPRVPYPVQMAIVIVVLIVCALILLNFAGYPIAIR